MISVIHKSLKTITKFQKNNLTTKGLYELSNNKNNQQGAERVFLNEESIKKKIDQLKKKPETTTKNRLGTQNSKNPDLMPFYSIPEENKQILAFRKQTGTENLFAFSDPTLEVSNELMQITSYDQEFIEVSGYQYPPSVILTNTQVFNWEVESAAAIKLHHFSILNFIDPYPEYVIVGLASVESVPEKIKRQFKKRHRHVDFLDIFEAASQFNTVTNNDVNCIAFINTV